MSGIHAVIGGSGGAGSAIAKALIQRGLKTRVISRSGTSLTGAESVAADITTPEAVDAVSGADVVYMAAQPNYSNWLDVFPRMIRSVIDATASAKARLVMVDNLYMYGPGHASLSETTAIEAKDKKGRLRGNLAEELLDQHRRGWLEVVIGRSSDYFGPGSATSSITELALKPLRNGGPIRWMGSGNAPHSVAYLPDLGQAFVDLATADNTGGQVWHMPHSPPVTGDEFLARVAQAAEMEVKQAIITKTMLSLAAPFQPTVRQLLPLTYQWTGPWVVDDSKFRKLFPTFQTTDLDQAIRDTVAFVLGRCGAATPPDAVSG